VHKNGSLGKGMLLASTTRNFAIRKYPEFLGGRHVASYRIKRELELSAWGTIQMAPKSFHTALGVLAR